MNQPFSLPPGRDFPAVADYADAMVAYAPDVTRLGDTDDADGDRAAIICWLWLNVLQRSAESLLQHRGFADYDVPKVAKASLRARNAAALDSWRARMVKVTGPLVFSRVHVADAVLRRKPKAEPRKKAAPDAEMLLAVGIVHWCVDQPGMVTRLEMEKSATAEATRLRMDVAWLLLEMGISSLTIAQALRLPPLTINTYLAHVREALANPAAAGRLARLQEWKQTLQDRI